MEMDCIPAGMELFPATDEEQWLFIQKIIDDSDYYILILGGRYGSMTADGVSYTEKEFDYAIEKGIKVIALIHGEPGKLPVEKSEMDPAVREKLEVFREKAATGRLVKFWTSADQLSGLVATSLLKTIKTFPAVGWVRADQVADNTKLLKQINDLRNINEKQKKDIEEMSLIFPEDIACGDDIILIKYRIYSANYDLQVSINELFKVIGSSLMIEAGTLKLKNNLINLISKSDRYAYGLIEIDNEALAAALCQLEALGLISMKVGEKTKLTIKGRAYLSKLLVARKPTAEPAET